MDERRSNITSHEPYLSAQAKSEVAKYINRLFLPKGKDALLVRVFEELFPALGEKYKSQKSIDPKLWNEKLDEAKNNVLIDFVFGKMRDKLIIAELIPKPANWQEN